MGSWTNAGSRMPFRGTARGTTRIGIICGCTLETACRQLASWRRRSAPAGQWPVSVNVDSQQLAEPGFVAKVEKILADNGLAPSSLILEVTETAMLADTEESATALAKLAGQGIELHIDDFGTGYATLSYLHQVPGHAVKIDRTFVTGMLEDDRHREIVRAIVSLAHNLGMETIAEGVETPLHRDALHELGCDHGQGFHFSRPVGAAALELLIQGGTLGMEETVKAAQA